MENDFQLGIASGSHLLLWILCVRALKKWLFLRPGPENKTSAKLRSLALGRSGLLMLLLFSLSQNALPKADGVVGATVSKFWIPDAMGLDSHLPPSCHVLSLGSSQSK